VAIRGCGKPGALSNAIVLENVQDPGNVGTVIRTANAFRIDAVILTGACADLYQPKTVRATMGAIFRQKVLRIEREYLGDFLRDQGLPLYGAALSDQAQDLRGLPLQHVAVAIGSEGQGLSRELLALCDGELIIPMNPDSESLNAAVAASIVMWEMAR
jgi:TrmH family RNA methyltransferase